MANEKEVSPKEPFIVVILGCTGTGKSKLAIEIGKEIGGEIISADSMQVYQGLDIITNKVTREEQATTPHHMINIVRANEKFSVVEFKSMALPIISDILGRQKVPIIVGGTNYYIESLLWENLIDEFDETTRQLELCKVESHEAEKQNKELISKNRNLDHRNLERKTLEHENPESEAVENENLEQGKLKYGNSLDCLECKTQQHENSEIRDSKLGNEKRVNLEQKCSESKISEQKFADQEILEHQTKNISSRLEVDEMARREQKSSQDLHRRLMEIDPTMAQKLHPHDIRKISRSLQIYDRCGVMHSELIAQQQAEDGATVYGGPMRFKNACVLWLQCELKTLDRRLDARVDKMLKEGLVDELLQFHNFWKNHCADEGIKNTEGIFQSIGFKEFHDFLSLENPFAETNGALFDKCVDSMKVATRRYARRQIKWVVNRFLGRPSTCAPDVYELDATDLGSWEADVLEKGLNIIRSLMNGERVEEQPLERTDSNAASKRSHHVCEVCNDRTIIGDKNWAAHLRSRSHRHYRKKAESKLAT